MKIDNLVVLNARQGKPSGNNIQLECPACHRFTMYYNPDNGGYYCHRATCNVKGYTKKGVMSQNQPKRSLYDEIFTHAMISATDAHMPRHYLNCISYPVWYLPTYKRIAFEVRGFKGALSGYVLRSYSGATPKSLTACRGVVLHVPRKAIKHNSRVVLVEDIVSSEKLSHITPSCAIMGTYIPASVREYLTYHGVRDIILALDPDASGNAIQQSKSLSEFNVEVKLLSKDPKDSSYDELREIFL